MRIIRYRASKGSAYYAETRSLGKNYRLEGAGFGAFAPTLQEADIAGLLVALVSVTNLCLGFNYRRLGKECGAIVIRLGVVRIMPDGKVTKVEIQRVIPSKRARTPDYQARATVAEQNVIERLTPAVPSPMQ